MASGEGASAATSLGPIEPSAIRIEGIHPVPRTIHLDPRGFLVETMRADDSAVHGELFRMSYSSLTLPGQFRDIDRWHLHQRQTDRFVVVLGEMTLVLMDHRPSSDTLGRFEVIRMRGVPWDRLSASGPQSATTYLVPIPPGVLHCIGNLATGPFLLQNYPTQLYDASDEGRVPFASLPVSATGRPFGWDQVPRRTVPP
jgi:dTDP-4-dehydrorhamnose 3,5-epimerase-like enzyme